MALAERRPIELSNNAISPTFNSSLKLGLNSSIRDRKLLKDIIVNEDEDEDEVDEAEDEDDEEEDQDEEEEEDLKRSDFSPRAVSPTSRSISPDSLMNVELKQVSRDSTPPTSTSTPSSINGNNTKKPKNPSRVPIATGISTTIPVTGAKPKPQQKGDPSLEDDVLYAIFVILYEKDPEGRGMTVKQICDILTEQHPHMANLSTKTSNLVSAKLNAYVKRVEKGDANLKYALSRDWADASPKRMVYVYRGLLAEDFHVHVKNLMEMQKLQQLDSSLSPNSKASNGNNNFLPKKDSQRKLSADDSLEAAKLAAMNKPRRQTMFDLGVTRNTFCDFPVDKSNLFVPYSSAPVTASLTEVKQKDFNEKKPPVKSIEKSNPDDKLVNDSDNDFEDFEDFEVFDDDDEDDIVFDSSYSGFNKNGKRSKSMSYLATNKKAKILTAAAAAPRASRAPSAHSVNAAAAAAALHAAALKANGSVLGSKINKKWMQVIKSGFLTENIGTPEDTSLSDIDKFFA